MGASVSCDAFWFSLAQAMAFFDASTCVTSAPVVAAMSEAAPVYATGLRLAGVFFHQLWSGVLGRAVL